MSKRAGGIIGVLDGILSQEKQRSPLPATATAIDPLSTVGGQAAENPDLSRLAGSRRGRPLGKAVSPRLPKEKVTLWLHSPLVASYRDWSWEARSQFSHLVEKALTDYYQRQRNPGPVTRYRTLKRKRLRIQVAKDERELVPLEQVRKDYVPVLVQTLEYTKSLYSDSRDETQMLICAHADKLITLLSTVKPKKAAPRHERLRTPTKPR